MAYTRPRSAPSNCTRAHCGFRNWFLFEWVRTSSLPRGSGAVQSGSLSQFIGRKQGANQWSNGTHNRRKSGASSGCAWALACSSRGRGHPLQKSSREGKREMRGSMSAQTLVKVESIAAFRRSSWRLGHLRVMDEPETRSSSCSRHQPLSGLQIRTSLSARRYRSPTHARRWSGYLIGISIRSSLDTAQSSRTKGGSLSHGVPLALEVIGVN